MTAFVAMNEELERRSHRVVRRFIPAERAKNLGNEFRSAAESENFSGDPHVPQSQCAYGYFPFLELLCEKVAELNEIVGEPLLPTYTYARVYGRGATLARHIDRPACEVSVTVHLEGDSQWDLGVEDSHAEPHTVGLGPGDAMVYLGCTAPHWREGAYPGDYYTQVFLHYVLSRGENRMEVFDQNLSGK
jgi:hypothetical protein